ncbi:unnamed protein product, partial [Brassica rapa subsp. narinosa]
MTSPQTCPTMLIRLSTEKPYRSTSATRFSSINPSSCQVTDPIIILFNLWEFTRTTRNQRKQQAYHLRSQKVKEVSTLSSTLTQYTSSTALFKSTKKTGKVHALPTLIHHNDYQRGVRPDFNLNDNKPFEDFQTHAFRLNSATQSFPIPFVPNWFYYPIDYQMSLDEDLQFYLDKSDKPQVVKRAQKKEKRNSESQECPPEYFQDAQLPDDSMNIDEVGRMFNIDINDDSQQPQEKEP